MTHGSENRKAREKVRIPPDVLKVIRHEAATRGMNAGEVIRSWMPSTTPTEPPRATQTCRYCQVPEPSHDTACPLWEEPA